MAAEADASGVARTTRVVAPHNTAASMPSRSPNHCSGGAAPLVKPSEKASATPPKAVTRPTIPSRPSRSLLATKVMPAATTKGARYRNTVIRPAVVNRSPEYTAANSAVNSAPASNPGHSVRSRCQSGTRRHAAQAKTSRPAPTERIPAWVSGGTWVSATFEAT